MMATLVSMRAGVMAIVIVIAMSTVLVAVIRAMLIVLRLSKPDMIPLTIMTTIMMHALMLMTMPSLISVFVGVVYEENVGARPHSIAMVMALFL